MAEAATQAGAGLDIQSILSRDDETNAYELILAVCENSVADYSKFLEVMLSDCSSQQCFICLLLFVCCCTSIDSGLLT